MAVFLGQLSKEVRPTASCAEKRVSAELLEARLDTFQALHRVLVILSLRRIRNSDADHRKRILRSFLPQDDSDPVGRPLAQDDSDPVGRPSVRMTPTRLVVPRSG